MREPVRARASRWLLSPNTWKLPAVGAINPARNAEQGGLARTVWPQQTEDSSGGEGKVNAVQGGNAAEPHSKSLGDDRRRVLPG